MKNTIILLSLFTLITACKKEEPDALSRETVIRVNHHKEKCSSWFGQATCYLVQQDKLIGTETWEYLHNEIEGFDYQEGFTYLLKVKIEKVNNPPIDSSGERYTLLKVLSKE